MHHIAPRNTRGGMQKALRKGAARKVCTSAKENNRQPTCTQRVRKTLSKKQALRCSTTSSRPGTIPKRTGAARKLGSRVLSGKQRLLFRTRCEEKRRMPATNTPRKGPLDPTGCRRVSSLKQILRHPTCICFEVREKNALIADFCSTPKTRSPEKRSTKSHSSIRTLFFALVCGYLRSFCGYLRWFYTLISARSFRKFSD